MKHGSRKSKVRVTKERTVTMYADMWEGSTILFRRAQQEARGNYWVLMSVLLLTAFTFEAYLNHIGPQLFKSWSVLERLSPMDRLAIVCEKLGISFPPGERPRQSLVKLFQFRNDLAHGKNETLRTDEIRDNSDEVDSFLGERPKTDWEKMITWPRVTQLREDVEEIIRKLHAAGAPHGDSVFLSGATSHSATAKLETESA